MQGVLKHWDVIGYYPSAIVQDYPQQQIYDIVGEPFCPPCADVHSNGNCGEECCDFWDLSMSEPIYYWSESDTPTHCTACNGLIDHHLTPDGIEYVREALETDPDNPTVKVWADTYLI